jgi:hypothetical protein
MCNSVRRSARCSEFDDNSRMFATKCNTRYRIQISRSIALQMYFFAQAVIHNSQYKVKQDTCFGVGIASFSDESFLLITNQ